MDISSRILSFGDREKFFFGVECRFGFGDSLIIVSGVWIMAFDTERRRNRIWRKYEKERRRYVETFMFCLL